MDYKLIRCKRKTIAITVRDGEVTVKAPRSADKSRIEAFVEQKRGWIEKKSAEFKKRADALKDVISGECVLISGDVYPVVATEKYGRVRFEDGALLLPLKLAESAQKAIGNWYRRTAETQLKILLDEASARTGLCYKEFSLTNAQGKWGSCDGENNIRLNWRLYMLDDALKNYVIIHELCHTVCHNHSPEFWAHVKKFCPDCAKLKKRFKDYSVLTSLYR